MRTVRLIRDKLPTDYDGESFAETQISEELHHLALVLKMHEEVAEIGKAMDDPWEYADLLQAMQDLAGKNGLKWKHILKCRQRKYENSGGFKSGKVMVRYSTSPVCRSLTPDDRYNG